MPVIDYYYSAHSAYAYLGAPRLYEICAAHGVQLIHRPMALSPVVEAAGGLPFAGRTQPHVDYFFGRELERWAEWRVLPMMRARPTYHDAPYDLANQMIIAAQSQGHDANAFSFAILQAHWRDDADLSDPAVLGNIAQACGLDGATLQAAAQMPEITAEHQANTDAAIRLSLFGSPSYVVAGDIFYGQDRLEMVDRALHTPFAPREWSNPPVDTP